MSKASTKLQELEEVQTEIEQYEQSAELATDFIYDELLPLLEEFENENEDPNYMYGVATHGLFVELIHQLGEMGYTEKELKKEIKIHLNSSYGQVVH